MLLLGLVDIIPWWVLLLTAFMGLVWYCWPDADFFRSQGIHCDSTLPFIGTMQSALSKPTPYVHLDIIKKHGDKKCVGGYLGNTPVLTVLDAEMLSEIMVKQSPTVFTNRMTFLGGSAMQDNMLLNLHDAHWKHVRTEMTPTFTSGKLKKMNAEINRCSRTLADSLLEQAEKRAEVEMKEFAGGYTMDVIASTAFGIRVDSQKDRNNEFVEHARRGFDIPRLPPVMLVVMFFPKLANILLKLGVSLDIFPKDIRDFFENITRQTIEMRKSDHDKSRTDFIQLMIKAQKGENISDEDEGQEKTSGTGLTTDEILSNAMLFLVAGYDTTATALTFFMYSMARYPEIQDRLMDEIDSVVGDKDEIDTNDVQEMPYLEQCLNETMRMYPSLLEVNRIAKEDTTVQGVFIKKGTFINLPIYLIHNNPKHWPEPNKFIPERFSAENKRKHNPYYFMPFGHGPRNCIGMRLALLELKVAIVHVMRKVKVTPSEKTKEPLIFCFAPQLLKVKDGVFVNLEPRLGK